MLRATIFFVVALFALSHGAPSESEWDWRIVGGSNAAPGSANYQVSLRSTGNSHFCGGSILNSRTIVTAAHCVVGRSPLNTIVIVGTTTLNAGGIRYSVSKITAHPSYNANLIFNDVAVVITNNDIVLGGNVQAIPLSTGITAGGVTTTLTGWGTTSYPGSAPNNLQTINLKTLDYAQCESALASVNPVYETQICTLTKAGEGACHGDSGGPLVANGQLVGIVSWGSPCAKGLPDVFTRVSSFASWINDNAQN